MLKLPPSAWPRLGLLALAVWASFFLGLNAPLFDEDEGAYAEVAREMVVTGDYLVPRFNGTYFFHKPPLLYWAQAASIKVFGLSEFAVRFPSALAAGLWVLTIYLFAARFLGAREAFWAAFLMTTAVQMTIMAKAAIHDTFLSLFIAWSLVGLYNYYLKGGRWGVLLAHAGLGLGLMTKGPVAAVVVVGTSFLFFLARRRVKAWFKAAFDPWGLVLLLVLVVPWHLYVLIFHGRPFIEEYVLTHNLGRFGQAMAHHDQPFFYYLPVVLAGLLPYTKLCLQALWRVRDWFKDDLNLFAVIWFGFTFVFFSLTPAKLPHYLLPAYPAVFLLMGRLVDEERTDGHLFWPVLLAGLVGLAAVPFLGYLAGLIPDALAAAVLRDVSQLIGSFQVAVVAGLLIGLALVWRTRWLSGGIKVVVLGLSLSLFVNTLGLNLAGEAVQGPVKEAARLVKEKNLPVAMWGLSVPSFLFYRQALVPKRPPKEGELLLTKIDRLAEFKDARIIFRRGVVLLVDPSGKK